MHDVAALWGCVICVGVMLARSVKHSLTQDRLQLAYSRVTAQMIAPAFP